MYFQEAQDEGKFRVSLHNSHSHKLSSSIWKFLFVIHSITPLPLNDISCLMEWLYQKIELFISDVLFNCQLANKVIFQHVSVGYIPLKVLQIWRILHRQMTKSISPGPSHADWRECRCQLEIYLIIIELRILLLTPWLWRGQERQLQAPAVPGIGSIGPSRAVTAADTQPHYLASTLPVGQDTNRHTFTGQLS